MNQIQEKVNMGPINIQILEEQKQDKDNLYDFNEDEMDEDSQIE